MSADPLIAETRDRVLYVTLRRPEKHNALSLEILDRIRTLFEGARDDDMLVAAVLTGAGDKTFAAGGDLRELAGLRSAEEAREMARNAKAALDAIRAFPVPVIAALNGSAFGGGAELAVACDFRVASRHSRIGFVQGRLKVSTAWGGGPDLLELVGRTRGLRLMATSEMLTAEHAHAIGLYDEVAREGATLGETVEAFLEPMRAQAPQAMRAFKAVADSHRRGDGRSAMCEIETRMFLKTWVHDDHWQAAEKVFPPKG